MLNYLLHKAPKTQDGILYHNTPKPWVWSDAAYMAPPFLAIAGHHKEAVRQLEGYRDRLFDPEKQLYSHVWDEGNQVFHRKNCWVWGMAGRPLGSRGSFGACPRR